MEKSKAVTRSTDNTTIQYKTLQRKQKIKQHESTLKSGGELRCP